MAWKRLDPAESGWSAGLGRHFGHRGCLGTGFMIHSFQGLDPEMLYFQTRKLALPLDCFVLGTYSTKGLTGHCPGSLAAPFGGQAVASFLAAYRFPWEAQGSRALRPSPPDMLGGSKIHKGPASYTIKARS